MARLSSKLRSSGETNITWWCPGCDSAHSVNKERWHWNGDAEKPTLSPSVRHFVNDPDTGQEETLCHYFIVDGVINFCSDSNHALAGKQSVPIPDWPYAEGEYGGV